MSQAGYVIERIKWGGFVALIVALCALPAALTAFAPTEGVEALLGYRHPLSSAWELFVGLVAFALALSSDAACRALSGAASELADLKRERKLG